MGLAHIVVGIAVIGLFALYAKIAGKFWRWLSK
jgi:hypothetical protein